MSQQEIQIILTRLSEKLLAGRHKIITAESCTGGLIAAQITAIAGSSRWFDRGVITYSNQSKTDLLGVDQKLIRDYGAVSEPVAQAMAQGALASCQVADYALAVTGIAGPDGGTTEKPVGTIWFGWALRGVNNEIDSVVRHKQFQGGRRQIQWQTVAHALSGLLEILQKQ